MLVNRRQMLSFAAAAAASPFLSIHACAAAYPDRPVRMLVGFPAGGTADILARMIGDRLREEFGQAFIVENRPGAATNLATQAVVRAPADGYTLLATTTSNLLNGSLYEGLSYEFMRDIAPVSGVALQPLVLLTTPSISVGSVSELISYAKANPGALNVGNFGTGTISHLAAEAFKQATGIEFVSVPHRGSPQMLTEMLGGRIHAAFDTLPAAIEHIRSESLRALAVTSAESSKSLSVVPPMSAFIDGFEAITIAGVGAPRGTPQDIIDKLNTAINAALAHPTLSARLEELGSTPLGGSPSDFAQLIARETERWGRVIRTSGIKMK